MIPTYEEAIAKLRGETTKPSNPWTTDWKEVSVPQKPEAITWWCAWCYTPHSEIGKHKAGCEFVRLHGNPYNVP